MHQAKFSLTQPLIEFLNHYKQLGFKDKSSMVQAALLELKRDLDQQNLKLSAHLYAEVYEAEAELQELTDAATAGWPE